MCADGKRRPLSDCHFLLFPLRCRLGRRRHNRRTPRARARALGAIQRALLRRGGSSRRARARRCAFARHRRRRRRLCCCCCLPSFYPPVAAAAAAAAAATARLVQLPLLTERRHCLGAFKLHAPVRARFRGRRRCKNMRARARLFRAPSPPPLDDAR